MELSCRNTGGCRLKSPGARPLPGDGMGAPHFRSRQDFRAEPDCMLNRLSIDAVAAAAAGSARDPSALRFVLLLAHPVDAGGRAHRRAELPDPAP